MLIVIEPPCWPWMVLYGDDVMFKYEKVPFPRSLAHTQGKGNTVTLLSQLIFVSWGGLSLYMFRLLEVQGCIMGDCAQGIEAASPAIIRPAAHISVHKLLRFLFGLMMCSPLFFLFMLLL